MTEPRTAAGKRLDVALDAIMAVVHGIATADLPENIAAQAKTPIDVKREMRAAILAIEAEAYAEAEIATEAVVSAAMLADFRVTLRESVLAARADALRAAVNVDVLTLRRALERGLAAVDDEWTIEELAELSAAEYATLTETEP